MAGPTKEVIGASPVGRVDESITLVETGAVFADALLELSMFISCIFDDVEDNCVSVTSDGPASHT